MNDELAAITAGRQACPQCDLLFRGIEPKPGELARCPRCGCVVASSADNPATTALLLCLTGAILYFPTILAPILSMDVLWMHQSGTIAASIAGLFRADYPLVSLIVLFLVVIFPAFLLISLGIVALSVHFGRMGRRAALLFRMALVLEEWAMIDIFLVGVLVTIFKMLDAADIAFGGGFLTCLALTLTLISLSTISQRRLLWRRISAPDPVPALASEARIDAPAYTLVRASAAPARKISAPLTAAAAGLVLCLTCRQLQRPAAACWRCGAALHQRHPDGTGICWALLVTSAILLVPANILPIMEVESLGQTSSSTIIDGIIYFFQEGNYLIGMIIFVASILVPVLKLVALAMLLITAQGWHPVMLKEKTALYRFIAFIGRWSMLDIFVIALLNAMVQFGMLSSVRVAPAATWFCLAVITTMLATHFFDPRLMWDAENRRTHDEYSQHSH